MTLKKGDFVEVEYTGTIKENGTVFDTTDKKVATDNNIPSENVDFGPIVIVLREEHLLKGLDERLEGKEVGSYEFDIPAEEAFGKKSAQLIKLVPLKAFAKDDIKPFVGMEVSIDNQRGIVRSVSGGRILVDFNHPLSGKDVHYKIKANKVITDGKEKIQALGKLIKMPIKSVAVDGQKAVVLYSQEFPAEITKEFEKEVTRMTGITIHSKHAKAKPVDKPIKPEKAKDVSAVPTEAKKE